MGNEPYKEDASLIDACIRKDLSAWKAFVEKYSHLITISIENRVRKYGIALPREDVEDIKQDTLASLWNENKLKTVRNRENIVYWLSAVAGNDALSYITKKDGFRDRLKLVPLSEKPGEMELIDFIPSPLAEPKEILSKKELWEKASCAIESLPYKERLIMKLYLLHDKKYREIAAILNLPRGTVSSYIKRSKEGLKKALREFLIIFATISPFLESLYIGGLL